MWQWQRCLRLLHQWQCSCSRLILLLDAVGGSSGTSDISILFLKKSYSKHIAGSKYFGHGESEVDLDVIIMVMVLVLVAVVVGVVAVAAVAVVIAGVAVTFEILALLLLLNVLLR